MRSPTTKARGGVVQVGDAGGGEGAADGRRRMQGIEGDAVGSRGADVGKIVAIGDVAAGERLGAPQGKGKRAGFLMLAAVRIVRAQALPAGVIQVYFRQGEDVGLFCQQGSAFTGSVGVVEVDVVPDEVFSRLGRVCQEERMQQPQDRSENSGYPKSAPMLTARQAGGEEEDGGVIGQGMAEQFSKPEQTAELATDERGETEQGEDMQGAGHQDFHGGYAE